MKNCRHYCLLISLLWNISLHAQPGLQKLQAWKNERYNMFIHWGGIYSVLGGVWDGKPVRRGLSEQIQAHAGIYSDTYAAVAKQFNPTKWNADSVAILAKQAGMRAIIFTSKHHDGFCMWDTKTTDFNVVKATPFKRDVVKELAEACKRQGLKFGLYFSNIDWHFPEASPISSHNSDSIPPLHHQYNLAQVRELLSNYGEISELWFDMGSNTLEQSRAMREMVHQLQPNCMIGSRLGNDMGDFTVLSDNQQPDYEIGVPWQSPASFFDETWGYRSWQKRMPEKEKLKEKLSSLIRVAGRGGKYLLNIGPKGDGEVVPYERDILLKIGRWLKVNQEAIYGTAPDPFRENFRWGAVTCTADKIYLIIMDQPEDNRIELPRVQKGHVQSANILGAPSTRVEAKNRSGKLTVQLPDNFHVDDSFKVIALSFKNGYQIGPAATINLDKRGTVLNHHNAFKYFSNSGIDYNSRFISTVKESWNLLPTSSKSIEATLWYTDQERGRQLMLNSNGKIQTISLEAGEETPLTGGAHHVRWEEAYVSDPVWSGIEPLPKTDTLINYAENKDGLHWRKLTDTERTEALQIPADRGQAVYYAQRIITDRDTRILIKVTSGDGITLALNGENRLMHNNPNRGGSQSDIVLLSLKKGVNQLLVRSNNMFQTKAIFSLETAVPQRIYRKKMSAVAVRKNEVFTMSWSLFHPRSMHETINMPNLSIQLK